jgi:hypothetical protein
MSTPPKPIRLREVLPPWLPGPRLAEFGRRTAKDGKTVADRVMVTLTIPQREGVNRILAAAKRERVPLTEPDILRVALDRLIADYRSGQPAGVKERPAPVAAPATPELLAHLAEPPADATGAVPAADAPKVARVVRRRSPGASSEPTT